MQRLRTALQLILLVMLMSAGLSIATAADANAHPGEFVQCRTTDHYQNAKAAKAGFVRECGQRFQETTAFSCGWGSNGWFCEGIVSTAQRQVCSGDFYRTGKIAKKNFRNDCGVNFQERPAFRCDWSQRGYFCSGPGR